ncbi:MBL fold metallo-hydrolase [Paenibacillus lemnae]|uniref:MBL fold metallo-hydrolase n=1 Tax=Paenibacillus lemnae TaxID=1330551 RepID=A0A848M7Z9_PAELE|nr:MBL fold metallo-hydrolase [Paenibacillus lemnae]NMO96331.1 MBL fold metallo-hydrolase [Paenibacillus lemnae]
MSIRAISVHEVAQKLIRKEPMFILDVRNTDQFQDWKIEGAGIQHLNVPYFDLLDGVEEILEQLPPEEIVVVCAKEGSSIMVAELLSEQGRRAAYMEGGMKAWSEHLVPLKVGDLRHGGELYQFVRLGKGCLSYMAVSGGEAVVVDATRMIHVYTDFARNLNVNITHVVDTHLHADHISGGRAIAQETGAEYWLPAEDAQDVAFAYEKLGHGTEIKLGSGEVSIKALYSPGHTIGSTSLVIDDQYLFSGDILFIDSIGRPDLAGEAGSWAMDLRETLYKRYRDLAEQLIVLPSHFMIMDELNEDGTVAKKLGELFLENHGLNLEKEAFVTMVSQNLPPQPNAYQDIRNTNMGKMSPDHEAQREMEIGPNRCAVR